MSSKMLIDASHQEETRVVVVRGNRIEEFDYESAHRKQLRGNIYLARVTRVEPSLQAAFVEYGGNRHGFLAFGEIHPDYYQIPVADRQALLAEEASAAREDEDDEDDEGGRRNRQKPRRAKRAGKGGRDNSGTAAGRKEGSASDEDDEADPRAQAAEQGGDHVSEPASFDDGDEEDDDDDDQGGDPEQDAVDSVGEEDALEEVPVRRASTRKQYKIQEVVKRRQILLVQVVKEERGNKGAALTTYLSLAGRYSVLMPNTARGGGISRKITNAADRKRLRSIVDELEVPDGMGVILRTAGANRTKVEVKRDYEYLMRLWDNVRDKTLASTAPCLVYEEGSLIKRSIRDLYGKDIDEVLVSGEDGYREAKDFMRMLMPSHAKAVQPYRDPTPIFSRSGIEASLDKMLQPSVTLKSGGYIIINQTEALVSIDVNSGRSTKEHSIENTALQTNLEAAEEVARQLRLRDLAGLIVIDFIDMMEKRNNRAVEKKLKDCLKSDRARIQVGRISHFGLLEMSRQRIRASVLESTMAPCPHCGGTGLIRADSSMALHVLRTIEETLLKDNRNDIIVRMSAARAMMLLNAQRKSLLELEARFGVTIKVEVDAGLSENAAHVLKGGPATIAVPRDLILVRQDAKPVVELVEDEDIAEEEDDTAPDTEDDEQVEASDAGEDEGSGQRDNGGRKRRRKRRRGGRDRDGKEAAETDADGDGTNGEEQAQPQKADGQQRQDGNGRRKRRRGRRSGRRFRNEMRDGVMRVIPQAEPVGFTPDELDAFARQDAEADAAEMDDEAEGDDSTDFSPAPATVTPVAEAAIETAPVEPLHAAETVGDAPETPDDQRAESVAAVAPETKSGTQTDDASAKPQRKRVTNPDEAGTAPKVTSNVAQGDGEPAKPKSGWWRRGGGFL
ncbi:MAG: Rne/Rng family ribonuclease [Rhizobiaceae bacterium]|nr:Rne/Rng family ribonuclease [Rhizobiaceae bacterium]